jgi:hypothetical protein
VQEFFKAMNSYHSKARIIKLALIDGGIMVDPELMSQLYYKFYNDSYKVTIS